MGERKGRSRLKSTHLRGGSYKLPKGGYNSTSPIAAGYRNQVYKRTGDYGSPSLTRSENYADYKKHMGRAGIGELASVGGYGLAGFGPAEALYPGFAIGAASAEYTRNQRLKAQYDVDKVTGTKKSRLGGYYQPKVMKKSFNQKYSGAQSAIVGGVAVGAVAIAATTKKELIHGSQANGGKARYRYTNPIWDHNMQKVGHWSEGVANRRADRAEWRGVPKSKSLEIDIRRPVQVSNLAHLFETGVRTAV